MYSRVCVTAKEFKIRRPESFTLDANKPAQNLPQREALFLPYWTAFCSARKDTLFLPYMTV